MRRSLPWILAALLLAGCTGTSGVGTGDDVPRASFSAETGGVEGIVMDPELVPIEGALVRVLGTNVSVNTTAEGRFAISELVPQTYLAIITKAGFHEKKHGFEVPFGNVSRQRIILDPVPPPLPYVDQGTTLTGFVRLGYSYRVASQSGNSSGNSGAAIPEAYRATGSVTLRVEKHWQTILLELQWTPASSQSDELAMQVTWPERTTSGGTSLANKQWVVGGDTPLRWRLDRDTYEAMREKNPNLHPALSYGLPLLVAPSTDPTQPVDVGFYPEQAYRIYVSIGYNGPLAANHTRLAPS